MSAAPVLVSGASGFIGLRLCEILAERGQPLRALYRRKDPPAALAALAQKNSGLVELFNVDLCDLSRLERAASGAASVIHVAGLSSDWGPLELFEKHNYEATVNLLGAARRAGAGVFVHISSAVVSGFGVHVDSTEEGPYYPLRYPYQISKKKAEDFVLGENGPDFRTTAIRPCNVYGPRDHTMLYPMFEAARRGLFGYIGSGDAYTCPVYVDDLCAGIIAALESERSSGLAFIISDGQKVRWRDYALCLYEALGLPAKPRALPLGLALSAAELMSFFAKLLRSAKSPPLNMYRVEQVSRHYHFSIERARRLLGYEPRVFFREGIDIAARAFLEEGRAQRLVENMGPSRI